MLYTTRLPYTPALEPHEFNEHALIIDTETLGAGPSVEVIELAVGDAAGRVVFQTLVRPAYNRLPPPSVWFKILRALRGVLLLQGDSRLSLGAVAHRLGYADQSAFSRQVLSHFGIRPGVARQWIGWEPLVDRWLRSWWPTGAAMAKSARIGPVVTSTRPRGRG